MGYELNRLMKQYGIGTPTISSYTGQAMPTDKAATDYAQKLAQYESDKAAHDKYVDEYNRRLSGAPMYLQSQFQTKKAADLPTTVGGLYSSFLARDPDATGAKYWNETFGSNPIGATQMAQFIKAARPEIDAQNIQSKVGQNIYNATGSYYGDQLKYPTFAALNNISDVAKTDTTNVAKTDNDLTKIDLTNTNLTNTNTKTNNDTIGSNLTNVATMPTYTYNDSGYYNDQYGNRFLRDTETGEYYPQTNYAKGGMVRKFSRGGVNDIPGLSRLVESYGLANPAELPMIEEPVRLASVNTASDADPEGFPKGSTAEIVARGRAAVEQAKANSRAGVQVDPSVYDDQAAAREGASTTTPRTTPTAAPATARPSIDEMMKRYGVGQSQYGEQIRAASEKSRAETEAFRDMLKKQMAGESDNAPSKAEMYFRLAAALASPTKTGGIMENVGLAAKELGEYQKDVSAAKKANRARNLELMMKGQELSMRSAKEELDTLRALGAEESRDRRQFISEALREYIRSGEPESAAGKQAKDEGLVPGTPEFKSRVEVLGQQNVDARLAQINATLSGIQQADTKAKLEREKFEEKKKEAEEKGKQLTPKEVDLKLETETAINRRDSVIRALSEALQHNEKAFSNTIGDSIQRTLVEKTKGSSDARVNASRQLENILGRSAVEKLRETLGAGITDFEQKSMRALEGIEAYSKEERKQIILRALNDLQSKKKQDEERLKLIISGKYKEKTPDQPEGNE